jgi:ferric-dicitrate binding protein FerR (iron transport regulator)
MSSDADDDLTGATCTAFIVMSNRKGVEVGIRNGAVIIRPLRYDPRGDHVHAGRALRFDRDAAARLIRALVDAHAEAAKAGVVLGSTPMPGAAVKSITEQAS